MPMPDGKSMISIYCSAELKEHASQREIITQMGNIFTELMIHLQPNRDREWIAEVLKKNPLGDKLLSEVISRYK